jgi:hypothetical protein
MPLPLRAGSPGDEPNSNTALTLINKLMDFGIDGGAPGMKSSVQLAEDYTSDARFSNDEDRIKALVRWQIAYTTTTGFTTGLGGLITLPVTLPAGMGAAWIVQTRMIGTIAHIRGYDLADERVRTLALATLAGDATVREVTKRVGSDFATRAGKAAVQRVPGKVLIEINKKVGFRLLTKNGTTGVINLGRAVPLLGAVVGGAVDGTSTKTVAEVAKRAFPPTQRTAVAAA